MSEGAARYARQRREFALLMGVAWSLYGLSVLTTYPHDLHAIDWLPSGLDGVYLAGAYITGFGLLSLLSGYLAAVRPSAERMAYRTLVGAPLVLAGAMWIGAFFLGIAQGWTIGTGYVMFAAASYYMAGLRPTDAQIQEAKEAAPDGP